MTQPASSSGLGLAATVDTLAAQLIGLYVAAEQRLITDLAQIATAGLDAPTGSMQWLGMASQMRRAADRLATMLRARTYPLARQITEQAARHGDAYALAGLQRLINTDRGLLPRTLEPGGHTSAATARLALDLANRLNSTGPRLTRFADDAYRAAVTEAATRQLQHIETPATAQSRAWRRLTARGIDGFTDRTGRNWSLPTYVEMATRTTVQRSWNAAHHDRMAALGIEYFTVTHDGHPCPLCRPWEGAVLSDGPTGMATAAAADHDAIVAFNVKATVEEAITAGLQHPNCEHVLIAYLPGVTRVSEAPEWTAADQARYDATQQLRALERRVRQYKREALGALTEPDRRTAAAKARATQALIRQHVEAHGLVRRTRREQLNLGNR
jgi:hypothetical protein